MQDTPAIKITYTATVIVDAPYVVYMSANLTSVQPVHKTMMEYKFANSIPIPSYLIAISVGNITEQSVGKRSKVITEPVFLDSCVKELSGLETLLSGVESYMMPTNPYMWGDYAIIVQPPSFPIGGMENPLLTFASPTIIVGDQS